MAARPGTAPASISSSPDWSILYRPAVGFAAITLLEAAGFEVEVPSAQACCGQPTYNSRDRATAADLARAIVADLVRSRLVQEGLTVSEMRLRSSVFLDRRQGEITLSRNPRALMPPPNAAAIVTGTYAIGDIDVYVSLKVISTADARIISAADFVVPKYQNVNGLLYSNNQ